MAQGENGARPRLGELLIRDGRLSQDQLQRGLDEQKSLGGRIGRHLVELGFIDEATLLDALARQLRIPYVDLDAPGAVNPEVARYARADLCEQWGFCPVAWDQARSILTIAVSDPDSQLVSDIESLIGLKVEVRVAPADAIERGVLQLYHGGGNEQPVRKMQGLQLARSAQKEARGSSSGLDALGPPSPAPPPPPAPPMPPGVNPFDAQIAQQLAMQQQYQQQLHQMQLHQMQLQGAPAPQGYPPAAPMPAPAYPAAPFHPPPAGAFPGFPFDEPAPAPPPAPTPAPQTTPPPPPAPPVPRARRAAPMLPEPETPSVDALLARVDRLEKALADQTERMEKTLAAQARALRSLVDVLVDRGLVSKSEMSRKQQEYAKGGGNQ